MTTFHFPLFCVNYAQLITQYFTEPPDVSNHVHKSKMTIFLACGLESKKTVLVEYVTAFIAGVAASILPVMTPTR